MAVFKEYPEYDAIGLAELVRNREITAGEVSEAALYFIEKLNPMLNAFVSVLQPEIEAGIERANSIKACFTGVPMAIKECVAGIRGVEQKYGSRISSGCIPEQDEEVIRRYRNSGFVFMGQTNAPEFSSSITTESVLYGKCNNPWNLNLTVGGSSGGSGCAVAAGLVPIASGNDSAGSIRIPASCNGLFGFKPSRGRVPNGPRYSEIWNGLFVQHALTRTVRDSAALLDISAGIDDGAPYTAPSIVRPYIEEIDRSPKKLRVAFTCQAPNNVPVDEACRTAVKNTALLLAGMGHELIEISPQYDGVELCEMLTNLIAINFSREMLAHAKAMNQPIGPDTVESCHILLVAKGRNASAADLMQFYETRTSLERLMGRFFRDYDLFLTPSLASLPVPHGQINANDNDFGRYFKRTWQFSPFAPLANICGLPSMNVPLHWSEKEIPVGTMITGKYGDEGTLFQLAGQLEQAQPWNQRHPPMSAWNLNAL